ncbi:XdhC family protein [Amorphus orientalis]|uniref:Xanthine dehydrogenase accessory factor n=1 Tax=Amorphus orientalis TaxID=649198 RepID=A0AAE3VR05_9HYPH|nr:XdhC family protein [Amorphus orientalis]MDQ0316576.1 xanthine dehydrogenase accessory factor [Amorphus orientalis]
MDLKILKALNVERAARRAAIVVTDLASGSQRLVKEADDLGGDPLADVLSARFRSGKSGRVEAPDGAEVFLTVHTPPARIVAIGAVHISQALAPMAALAGFDVTIIDPRTAFATPERFEGVNLVAEWPQDALPQVGLDPYTAVAALTHDPKVDDPALQAALDAGCFYVGALGSRKTHGKRRERLTELGIAGEDIDRIAAPIGLAIGAASPPEIAVAVLAQIIEALRKRPQAVEERSAA